VQKVIAWLPLLASFYSFKFRGGLSFTMLANARIPVNTEQAYISCQNA